MQIINAKRDAIWKSAPLLRLLFPLIAGILTQYFFPVKPVFLSPAFFLSLVLFIFCNYIPFSEFFGLEWIPGLIIQIAFFSFGRILIFVHQDILVEHSTCFSKNQPNIMLLWVLSDPEPKQNSYKCLALIRWLIKDGDCFNENEKTLVYFNTKLDASQVSIGDWIILRKELEPIENSTNSDFDYKKYCHLKHIYARVILKENEFVIVPHIKEKSTFSKLDALRRKLLIVIKKQIPAKSENSLLEALMVGFTDDLDPGLLKSYSNTGVIHIIAISGLHLALICHILQLGLQGVGKRKSGQWIKLIVILTCLWGYSFLSGASPSVIRAAMMFSLAFFARNILRETVLYNTLAASAFLLLCFDPYWIWDTGFQLSYAAVLSLHLFSKPVRDLLPIQNKILASIWNAASVSIAAQILTTPISIFYFHRFPSYFLIANLLAVPLSSAILVGGILLCSCSYIYPLGQWLGSILGFLIRILNGFIEHVSQLPGAVVGQLRFTMPELIEVYFIIFCFYRFLKLKEKSWLFTGLSAICLSQIIRLI
jgi:competence protein ComEC